MALPVAQRRARESGKSLAYFTHGGFCAACIEKRKAVAKRGTRGAEAEQAREAGGSAQTRIRCRVVPRERVLRAARRGEELMPGTPRAGA